MPLRPFLIGASIEGCISILSAKSAKQNKSLSPLTERHLADFREMHPAQKQDGGVDPIMCYLVHWGFDQACNDGSPALDDGLLENLDFTHPWDIQGTGEIR